MRVSKHLAFHSQCVVDAVKILEYSVCLKRKLPFLNMLVVGHFENLLFGSQDYFYKFIFTFLRDVFCSDFARVTCLQSAFAFTGIVSDYPVPFDPSTSNITITAIFLSSCYTFACVLVERI